MYALQSLHSAPNVPNTPTVRRSRRGRFIARAIGALAAEFFRGFIVGLITR
jgi:starvation-inducible outer membrane lipoprotein